MSEAEMVVLSESPAATEAIGASLGTALRRGDVVVLEGPLGAGKTVLVRGMVAGAGGDPHAVRSPTFVLEQPHRCATLTLHHVDLYRLGDGASIDVLDLDTALEDGAAVIEWGQFGRLAERQPSTVVISGDGVADGHRLLSLHAPAAPHLAQAWRQLAGAR